MKSTSLSIPHAIIASSTVLTSAIIVVNCKHDERCASSSIDHLRSFVPLYWVAIQSHDRSQDNAVPKHASHRMTEVRTYSAMAQIFRLRLPLSSQNWWV
jgi:hypothetical protein